MARHKLPERRPSRTIDVIHGAHKFSITYGIDYRNGRIGDCFGDMPKATSDMAILVNDACVLISLALQCGATLNELAKSMHREPLVGSADETEQPASLIGRIVDTLIREQEELA